jgi:lipoprotein NlpI
VTSSAPTPDILAVNARLYARTRARLRSAPTSDSAVITRLVLGTILTATGHTADGQWWRVTLPDGSTGYVAEAGVMDHPPDAAAGAPSAPQEAAKPSAPTGKDSDVCKSDSGASAADRAASCRRLLGTPGLDANTHYNTLVFLGSALADLGHGDEAIRSYREAIDVDPKYYGAYYDIGMVHLDAGRYAEARAAFDKAAALKPDDSPSIFQRGVALADLGEFDTARADVERAIALKNDDGSYYDELALLQLQRGDLPAASASIDRAVSLSKDFWSGTAIFAYYLGGKFDRAIALAERGLKDQPDYPYFWVWKALAQEAGGDVPAGQATLAQGLKAFGKRDWPAPLLDYLAGKLPEDKMRALAKSNDAKTQAERLCEISYYVGERAFLDGDKAAARAAMRQSADTRIYNYLEFFAAEARLAGLNP